VIIDSIENKQKILSKFLEICVFEGWNKETLLKSFTACGIDEKLCDLVFENGCVGLADFYISFYNQKTATKITIISDFKSLKIRDKIRLLLYSRFEVENGNQIALQRLANFYLDIKNFGDSKRGARPLMQAIKSCYKIADFMWCEIGDQSTDFNYFTKRITLAKIILRSFRVFIRDESPDFSRTKAFIDREIEKVMKFEKVKFALKNRAEKIYKGVILDEDGTVKSPRKILKNLPFIRLIKF